MSRSTTQGGSTELSKIGSQSWSRFNASVVTYRNGDPIPQITNNGEWASSTTGAWCYFNNDPRTAKQYGLIYNWYAVNDARLLAPVGFRVPNQSDFVTLRDLFGGTGVAGGAIKAVSNEWTAPNVGATNSSGFTALPAGIRGSPTGEFITNTLGIELILWGSDNINATEATFFSVQAPNTNATISSLPKNYGFSVRFIAE